MRNLGRLRRPTFFPLAEANVATGRRAGAHRIADSSQTSRHVREVPNPDMAAVSSATKKPPEGGLSIQTR